MKSFLKLFNWYSILYQYIYVALYLTEILLLMVSFLYREKVIMEVPIVPMTIIPLSKCLQRTRKSNAAKYEAEFLGQVNTVMALHRTQIS